MKAMMHLSKDAPLQVRDYLLDHPADLVDTAVEFLLPVQEFASSWLLERVIMSLIEAAKPATRSSLISPLYPVLMER
jgi:hypothetical protein